MKAIMISIQPQYVADILNGKKTIEIRKTLPKCELPIEVYIYCTKGKDELWFLNQGATNQVCKLSKDITAKDNELYEKEWTCNNKLSSKVVAKFTLNTVEKINAYSILDTLYKTKNIKQEELLKLSCLTYQELNAYLKHKVGYAWHIDNLVIFDKPKDISEFKSANKYEAFINTVRVYRVYKPLTRAPQNYCFIEV